MPAVFFFSLMNLFTVNTLIHIRRIIVRSVNMDVKKETVVSVVIFLALVVLGFAVNYYFETVVGGFSYFSLGIIIIAPVLIAFAYSGLKYSQKWMIGAVVFSLILYIMYLFGTDWPNWIQMLILLAAGIYLIGMAYLKAKAEKEFGTVEP